MSGLTRPARVEELPRLWPLVRSAHLVSDIDALAAIHAEGPWQFRVSDEGDALVVGRWRAHLDVLAIRGVWAPERRVGGLVSDACAVARSLGLTRVVSPLVDEPGSQAYRERGMQDLERLVACTAPTSAVIGALRGRVKVDAAVRLRRATPLDVDALVALDAECFGEFWRHGASETLEALRSGHVTVASRAGAEYGPVGAYAVSLLSGSTVTVGRLAVAPRHRRSGLATALIHESAVWASEQRACGLSLCTQADNAEARALYCSAGFAELPRDYRLLIMDAGA